MKQLREWAESVVWSSLLAVAFACAALLTAWGVWSDWEQEDAIVLVGCGIIAAILSLRAR